MIDDPDAIVSLDAWRARKDTRGPECEHARTVLDERHGTVECRDCQATLSAFWVLGRIARHENRLFARVHSLQEEAKALSAWVPFLRSMRHLEKRWRGRKALPACPHCHRGLWPDELASSAISVELETAHRRKHGLALPGAAIDHGGASTGRTGGI